MENKDVKEFSEALAPTLKQLAKDEVQEGTKELSEGLSELKDGQKNIEDELLTIKKNFDAKKDPKEELYAKTAKFFKSLVKKDEKTFAEAKKEFLNEGTDADGGYLVPTEFSREVIRVAKEIGFARKYCRVIPMSTDTKDITSLVKGVTVYWTAEGAAYTESKPEFGRIQLVANKLTALVSGTNELIDDNQSNVEVFNLVRDLIAEAMAEFEDQQVLNGDGTGMNFQGVVGATGTTTGSYTLAAPTFKDAVSIKNSLKKAYRNSAVWVMNQDEFTKYEASVDNQGRPLFKESYKNDKSETTLLGYPVEVNETIPDGKVVFGNFDYYALGDRRGITFEAGYATGGWESDIKSLKASERIAGKILLPEAFVVATGA